MRTPASSAGRQDNTHDNVNQRAHARFDDSPKPRTRPTSRLTTQAPSEMPIGTRDTTLVIGQSAPVSAWNRPRVQSVQPHMRRVAACLVMAALAGCGDDTQEPPVGASEANDAQATLTTAQPIGPTAPATTVAPDQSELTNPPVATGATTPPPALDEMAIAVPDRVEPGDRVTITPSSAVAHNCTDIVGVYDFDDVIVGQLLDGGRWEPVVADGIPPTWAACIGSTTDASVEITVPAVPEGGYRFCISVVVDFVGCASLFVAAPSSGSDAAPPATSELDSAELDSPLGRVSYVLPAGSWADPQDIGQIDDVVLAHAWWIVPDCCYLKLTLQDFEPPRPPEEHVGQFESNGMAWNVYDIGPRDRSTVVASTTVNGLTVSVGAQGQSGASTDPSPAQIAESVARSVVVS